MDILRANCLVVKKFVPANYSIISLVWWNICMFNLISSLIFMGLNEVLYYVTCSLVTNCCYKLLENPGINRKHTLRDPIFQILGTMVKKHNLGLGMYYY